MNSMLGGRRQQRNWSGFLSKPVCVAVTSGRLDAGATALGGAIPARNRGLQTARCEANCAKPQTRRVHHESN